MYVPNKSVERRVVAENFACPDCGSRHLRRLPRQGFLQTKILPFFGYYPWECAMCRETKFFRIRGKRKRKSQS